MKKPLVDLLGNTVKSYHQEKKFISKFLRLWGTTSIRNSAGVLEEVLLPANFIYTDGRHTGELHTKFLYRHGGNTWKDGRVYHPELFGGQEKLDELIAADHAKYDTTQCLGFDLIGDNPTAFIQDGEVVTYVRNEDGTVQTDFSGAAITQPAVDSCTADDGTRGWPKQGTRVRELLKMLDSWDAIRDNGDIPKANTVWLYLNPGKGGGVNDDNVRKGLNTFIETYKDVQGRTTLKAKILFDSQTPVVTLKGLSYIANEVEYPAIPGNITNVEYVTETVHRLDANGEKIFRPVYVRNADGSYAKDKSGKLIPTGRVYPDLVQESVPRCTAAEAYLQANMDLLWSNTVIVPLVENSALVQDTPSSVLEAVTHVFAAAAASKYEKVCATAALMHGVKMIKKSNAELFGTGVEGAPANSVLMLMAEVATGLMTNNSGMRISNVSRGIDRRTVSTSSEWPIQGSYYTFGDETEVIFSGYNTNSDGMYNYEVTYTVPTLEFTMVIRNVNDLVIKEQESTEGGKYIARGGKAYSPFLDVILQAALHDYWSWGTADDDSGFSTSGIRFNTKGINNFNIYTLLKSSYTNSVDPSAMVPIFTAGSHSGFFGDIVNIKNPDMWIIDNSGPWGQSWSYLKAEVLTTDKYIKSRSERIAFVMGLLDSDYDADDGGGGIGGFIGAVIGIIVVVVAVVIGVFINPALGMLFYQLAMAALGSMFKGTAVGSGLAQFQRTIAPMVQAAALVVAIISIYDTYIDMSSTVTTTEVYGANGVLMSSTTTTYTPFATYSSTATTNAGASALSSATSSGYTAASVANPLIANSLSATTMDRIIDAAMSKLTNLSLDQAMQIVNLATKMHYESELAKLQRGIKSKQQKLEEQKEAQVEDKYQHSKLVEQQVWVAPLIGLEALLDVESMYEPSGNTHHSGCSQRSRKISLVGDALVNYCERYTR